MSTKEDTESDPVTSRTRFLLSNAPRFQTCSAAQGGVDQREW